VHKFFIPLSIKLFGVHPHEITFVEFCHVLLSVEEGMGTGGLTFVGEQGS
jgi:hypothetical protein